MRIGPLTIRWTADVEREQAEREKTEKVQRKRIVLLTAELIKLKAVLHRWGLDQGVYGRGAMRESKTPRGAGVDI